MWYLKEIVVMMSRRTQMDWKWIGRSAIVCLLVLAMGLMGCGDRPQSGRPAKLSSASSKRFEKVVEVSPPDTIQALRKELDIYQPQVRILSPRQDDIIDDTQVTVQLDVNDLPIFKDEEFELGPHLHVLLDNQNEAEVYDTDQPLVLENLAPGTHTLRVFASRPWHESFKNAGAYDQVTFSIFTTTVENNPAPESPLLTYSQPDGTYGAQPIMLDFYLANAPLHVLARESDSDDLKDWNIRGTVNGQSFTFDTWEPIYLKGFVPGLNWVKLELVDDDGHVFDGPFNSTAHLIDYQPTSQDTLSRLIRGELAAKDVLQIVDPDYEPEPEPEPEPAPQSAPEAESTPVPPVLQPAPTNVKPPAVEAPLQEVPAPKTPEPETIKPETTEPKTSAPESPAPAPDTLDEIQPSELEELPAKTTEDTAAEPGKAAPDNRSRSTQQSPSQVTGEPDRPTSPDANQKPAIAPPSQPDTPPQIQAPSTPMPSEEKPSAEILEQRETAPSSPDEAKENQSITIPGDEGQPDDSQPGEIQFDVPETIDEPAV